MKASIVKRLAILIAVLGLLGGTGFIAHGMQLKRLGQNVIKEANSAIEKGDFANAEMRFRDYLRVFPGELEIQIAHADTLLKVSKSLVAQQEALLTYENVLKQSLGRLDIRRKLMQLKFDLGRFISSVGQVDGADYDLRILLKESSSESDRNNPLSSTDGDLQFLLGRCYEEKKDDPAALANAVALYQKAIENNAAQRIEAGERCATLLRDKLQQPKEAEQVINSLVAASPKDYRGYLARGRWRAIAARDQSEKSLALDAEKDFKKAREFAKSEPEVYLQLAQAAMDKSRSKSDYNEARQILEEGLKNTKGAGSTVSASTIASTKGSTSPAGTNQPSSSYAIYEALANIEIRAGNIDKAIENLEHGLKAQPEQSSLRVHLTDLLVKRGETGKLLQQIEELKTRGHSQVLTNYFLACYYMNASQFLKARQVLVKLQTALARISDVKFKSRISVLLSQCYKELGEPEMERGALTQALSADPQDLAAKLGWIANLLNQGDIAGAIKEYHALAEKEPVVRPILARLLISQNQLRPESQRDWSEIEKLIDQAAETAPESVEPVVLRAELFLAQGKKTAAHDKLQEAQRRFPKNIEVRVAQANLMGYQKGIDDALKLLDQAQQQLGDQVDLRLERARLWTLFKKGPQVLKVLMDLSQDAEKFSKTDRKTLLNGLAVELVRQQDFEGASVLLTRLAEEDETNLILRRNLLDLALQNANKEEIEKNIKQIEAIEGDEGLLGRYCQIRYLIWQAQRATDKDMKEAIHFKARALLDDLTSRRGDWSVIPLASAELAEQELAQGNLPEDQIPAKEERIIGFYLQAIKLGQRHTAVVRRVVQLLFKHDRINNALELLSSIPLESQFGRQAVRFALENRDFLHAEQIARAAVAAKPDDFQERFWLVQILLASERPTEAAKALREAVDLSPDDPDRWVTFVTVMLFTKQPGEAEKIIHEAETKIPPSRAPLALGLCCEKMGEMYSSSNDTEMKKWNDAATNWYKKAEAAQPEDLSIKRRLTEFFRRSKQINEAHKYLEAMRNQNGRAKNAETAAWANRTLALVLASGTDRAQVSKALTFFEPDGQPVPAGQEGKKQSGDPEDLRVLARVLDMQRTTVHRKRAIEILESLTDQNLATSDDRFLLARLYEVNDDWPKARQKYDELNLRTRNLRDIETLNRRPLYLAQFTRSLLQHHKPGDEQTLIDAQELVDQIKQLQPNELGTLILQIEIHQIRKEIDKATNLIHAFADRPNTAPQALEVLADLAEKMNQFELSEMLYRQVARSADLRGKILLATFLGRRDRLNDALGICEPLWSSVREVDVLSVTCINILFGSNEHPRTPEPAQINRVVGWFEQAIAQVRNQQRQNFWLFLGLGNLREKQGRYSEAQKLYLLAAEGDPNGISYNNLAWLAALKDGKVKEALEYANRAIALKPDQPDFLDTRGMVYLVAGKRELALDDLQKAVAKDPLSPAKHYHLAQAFLALNDKEKARESLETAKAKGFTPNALDALEQPSYPNFVKELGSP